MHWIYWIVRAFKAGWPAVKRDPLAAALLAMGFIAQFFALSSWALWEQHFTLLDFVPAVFLVFLVWRLHRRNWEGGSLLFVGGVLFLALAIAFLYVVPIRGLVICTIEFIASLALSVRNIA